MTTHTKDDALSRAIDAEAADVAKLAGDVARAAALDGPTVHQRAELLLVLSGVREQLEHALDQLGGVHEVGAEDLTA